MDDKDVLQREHVPGEVDLAGQRRKAPWHSEALRQLACPGFVDVGRADDIDVGKTFQALEVELADAAGPEQGCFDSLRWLSSTSSQASRASSKKPIFLKTDT